VKAIINDNEPSIGSMAKKLARAMTLSARGNSGVILSQFFKGLSIGLEDKDVVNAIELTHAFESGVNQAYKVVSKPTEGTMLTVMREATQKAIENKNSFTSIEDFYACFIKEAHASLDRTPELLPVLKQAGVIDSGGAGYNRIIEGMISALDGNILIAQEEYEKKQNNSIGHFNADSVLEFGYCTEFILQLQNSKVNVKEFDIKVIVDFLETIGDSIVAFKDDDIVKVHVHTFTPGKVIDFCQRFGEYITFKMENMSVQHSELESIPTEVTIKEHKKFAIVAVSSGEGITNAFKELGADEIVSGGQTMNPSSEDFIEAFKRLDAENIIVFPNNKNIIMAAKQAAEAYEDANVVVMNTKSLAECYSALTMLDYSSDNLDDITDNFQMVIDNVVDGSITYAIRDSQIDDINIKKDDYMSFINGKIVASNSSKIEAVKALFNNVEDIEDKEVITLIYGKDVTDEEKNQVIQFLSTSFPSIEVGGIDGLQDIYSFIISIE
jgi:DAK2 domain fusion protein YloV